MVACTVVRMAVVGPAITALDTPCTYPPIFFTDSITDWCLDYQVTSNSWTFLEANVAIICACLPDLKGSIVRIFPCLSPKKNTTNGYPDQFSRDNYTSKNIISSHVRGAGESDEEFFLHNVHPAKVKMTTEIDITYGNKEFDQRRAPQSPPPGY